MSEKHGHLYVKRGIWRIANGDSGIVLVACAHIDSLVCGICKRRSIDMFIRSKLDWAIPQFADIGFRNAFDFGFIGEVKAFEQSKNVVWVSLQHLGHLFHLKVASFETLLQQDKRPIPIPSPFDLFQIRLNLILLARRKTQKIVNARRIKYGFTLLQIDSRLTGQQILKSEELERVI